MPEGGEELVLPYRTDAPGLLRFVEEVARAGRGARARPRDLSAKQWEGLMGTAEALGLYQRDADRLSAAGEALALASEGERRAQLERRVRDYPPYGELLRALEAGEGGGGGTTEVQWIETWWATRGYGSSPSNRAEGAATLGRLAEWLGWGRYVPGRRGHPTRIEWSGGRSAERAGERPRPLQAPAPTRRSTGSAGRARAGSAVGPAAAPPPPLAGAEVSGEGRAAPAPGPVAGGLNKVEVELSTGEVAELLLPRALPREEKVRLVSLVELLIREAPGG